MLTSLSRGTPRIQHAYVCTSCLTSVLTQSDIVVLRQPIYLPKFKSFSTTTQNGLAQDNTTGGRKKRTPGKRPTIRSVKIQRRTDDRSMPISSSEQALSAVRSSLEAESDTLSKKQPSTQPSTGRKIHISNLKAMLQNGDLDALSKALEEEGRTAANRHNPSKKPNKIFKSKSVSKKRLSKHQEVNTLVESSKAGDEEEPEPIKKSKKVDASINKSKNKNKKPVKKSKNAGTPIKSSNESNEEEPEITRKPKKTKEIAPQPSKPAVVSKLKLNGPPKEKQRVTIKYSRASIGLLIARYRAAEGHRRPDSPIVDPVRKLSVERAALVRIVRDKEKASLGMRRRAMQLIRSSPLIRKLGTTGPDFLGSKTAPSASQKANHKSIKDAMQATSSPGAFQTFGRKKKSIEVRTGPIKMKPGMAAYEIETIEARDLNLVPLEKLQPPVPRLRYGLERVLFNPGVYQLQDARTRVYNFDPYLQSIMPVNDFDFNALKEYITSSRDQALLTAAAIEKKKYTGSTSSMTSALAHFHYLLSQWRPINPGLLSKDFPVEYKSFTGLQKGPSAIFLRWKDGVYAIDADKQFDTANILSMLGKSMEKLLTLPTNDYENYRKENSENISKEERNESESYHYTTMGDFLMRSQLDAYDPRLPGTGMFDLKTRAVVSIRMDTGQFEELNGYEIHGRHGEYESYEREYYDMIRSAFLKYSLQVRMGRMDGIFVAFHNTARIFGFQYITLAEMDYSLHGSMDLTTGDSEFKLSLDLLNKVLDRATAKYPEKSLRVFFETRGESTETPFMYIFAEPVTEEEIQAIQEENKAQIEEFEERVLGLHKNQGDTLEEQKMAEWEKLRAKVEKSVERDELGVQDIKAIALQLAQESEVLRLSVEDTTMRIDELISSIAAGEGDDHEGSDRSEVDSVEEGVEGSAVREDGNDMDERVGVEGSAVGEDGDDVEVKEEFPVDEGEKMAEYGEETSEESTAKGERRNDEIWEEDFEELSFEGPEDQHKSEDTELVEVESLEYNDTEANEEGAYSTEELNVDGCETLSDDAEFSIQDDVEESVESNSEDLMKTENTKSNTAEQSESSFTEAPLAAGLPVDHLPQKPVLVMTITIRNKVNGKYVPRPEKLNKKDNWTVEYALAEIPEEEKSSRLYNGCKTRRKLALSRERTETRSTFNEAYIAKLKTLSHEGRKYREEFNEKYGSEPIKMVDDKISEARGSGDEK
ncbi:hypothetical protein B7494_g6615 [Chlorociboria aeruginascens]|nr:hypothetical protein B7494_g6615 [Chlorociboria aeruginascens]